MRIVFAIILSLLTTGFSLGQSFEIAGTKGTYKGHIGKSIQVPISIKNLTDRPIQIVIKRVEQVIGTSQTSYFCWGEDCFDSQIEQIPLSQRVKPGEVSNKFVSVLETGLVAGISTVKYVIYNRDTPSDMVEYEVNYTVDEDIADNIIFSSSDIKINEVYPNPANEFAVFDYNLLNEDTEAKIIMHNVLGSIVGEYELTYLETKLKVMTESMKTGVYFYTLYLDNDAAITRKLAIRR